MSNHLLTSGDLLLCALIAISSHISLVVLVWVFFLFSNISGEIWSLTSTFTHYLLHHSITNKKDFRLKSNAKYYLDVNCNEHDSDSRSYQFLKLLDKLKFIKSRRIFAKWCQPILLKVKPLGWCYSWVIERRNLLFCGWGTEEEEKGEFAGCCWHSISVVAAAVRHADLSEKTVDRRVFLLHHIFSLAWRTTDRAIESEYSPWLLWNGRQ